MVFSASGKIAMPMKFFARLGKTVCAHPDFEELLVTWKTFINFPEEKKDSMVSSWSKT